MDWNEFKLACKELSSKVSIKPVLSGIYGIPRGGCYVALEMASILNLPLLNEPKNHCLVVDDIVDSGRTIKKFIGDGFFTASLYLKPHSLYKPDYCWKETSEWVEFPWEIQNSESVEDNVVRIIQFIGDNPNRTGLLDTPKRVSKMYSELFKGYDFSQKPSLTCFENMDDGIKYDEMIFDSGSFVSWCEHHMLPFKGKYYFGYVPKVRIIGLSKVARLVEWHASRLQIQERLVKEIVDDIEKELEPEGIALVLKASHLCKEIRGVKNNGEMITSDVRGLLRTKIAARQEFMSLIAIKER